MNLVKVSLALCCDIFPLKVLSFCIIEIFWINIGIILHFFFPLHFDFVLVQNLSPCCFFQWLSFYYSSSKYSHCQNFFFFLSLSKFPKGSTHNYFFLVLFCNFLFFFFFFCTSILTFPNLTNLFVNALRCKVIIFCRKWNLLDWLMFLFCFLQSINYHNIKGLQLAEICKRTSFCFKLLLYSTNITQNRLPLTFISVPTFFWEYW